MALCPPVATLRNLSEREQIFTIPRPLKPMIGGSSQHLYAYHTYVWYRLQEENANQPFNDGARSDPIPYEVKLKW